MKLSGDGTQVEDVVLVKVAARYIDTLEDSVFELREDQFWQDDRIAELKDGVEFKDQEKRIKALEDDKEGLKARISRIKADVKNA